MANQFQTAEEIVRGVELEFGEPFLDLLRGFAADGESINSTACILNVTDTWLRRWIKKYADDIQWPSLGQCNARREAAKLRGQSAEHRTAALQNLQRAHVVNKERFAAIRKTTPEVMQRVIALREKGYSWRALPKLLNMSINPSTLERCYKRDYAEKK